MKPSDYLNEPYKQCPNCGGQRWTSSNGLCRDEGIYWKVLSEEELKADTLVQFRIDTTSVDKPKSISPSVSECIQVIEKLRDEWWDTAHGEAMASPFGDLLLQARCSGAIDAADKVIAALQSLIPRQHYTPDKNNPICVHCGLADIAGDWSKYPCNDEWKKEIATPCQPN